MKNKDISRLKKNYAINFKLGLIAALSFVIMAFNFTSVSSKPIAEVAPSDEFKTKEIEVIRTAHKKPLPPPTLELSENFETVEEVTMPDPEEPETFVLVRRDPDTGELEPQKKRGVKRVVERGRDGYWNLVQGA